MGFWSGFLKQAGARAHEQDMLDLQQQAQQKKDLYDFYGHLLDNPNLREERRGELIQNMQTLVGIPPGKKLPKEVTMDALLSKGSLLYSPEEQTQMAVSRAGQIAKAQEEATLPGKLLQRALTLHGTALKAVTVPGSELLKGGKTHTTNGKPIEADKNYVWQRYRNMPVTAPEYADMFQPRPEEIFEEKDPGFYFAQVEDAEHPGFKYTVAIPKGQPTEGATPIPGTYGFSPRVGMFSEIERKYGGVENVLTGERSGWSKTRRVPPAPPLRFGPGEQHLPSRPSGAPSKAPTGIARPMSWQSGGVSITPVSPETPLAAATPPPGTAPTPAQMGPSTPLQQQLREKSQFPGLSYEDLLKNMGSESQVKGMTEGEWQRRFYSMVRSYPSAIFDERVERIELPPQYGPKDKETAKGYVRQVLDSPGVLSTFEPKVRGLVEHAMNSVSIPIPNKPSTEGTLKEGFAYVTLQGAREIEQLVMNNPKVIGALIGRYGKYGLRIGLDDPFDLIGLDPGLVREIHSRCDYFLAMEAKMMMGTRPAVSWAQLMKDATAKPTMSFRMFMHALEVARDHALFQITATNEERWPVRYPEMMPPLDAPFVPGSPKAGMKRLDIEEFLPDNVTRNLNYHKLEIAVRDPKTGILWWGVPSDPNNINSPVRPVRPIWRR